MQRYCYVMRGATNFGMLHIAAVEIKASNRYNNNNGMKIAEQNNSPLRFEMQPIDSSFLVRMICSDVGGDIAL